MNIKKHIKRVELIMYILGALFCSFILNFVSEDFSTLEIIIYSFIFPFVLFSPFYIMTFFVKLGAKKGYKSNLSKIDFAKDKDYYRDIIHHYSPAELSYIDNLKPLEKKDVCATLLSLKLKGKIKIDKKIEVLDNSYDNLNYTECYILDKIKNGKVKNVDLKIFTAEAIKEASNHNLAKKNYQNKPTKDMISIVLTYIILYFIYQIIVKILAGCSGNNVIIDILDISKFLLSIIVHYGKYFIIGYIIVRILSCSRTNKGEEINAKLEGLKIYIKDFGAFKDREAKELVLWDDYLIYSVIFNIDKKAINDLKKLVD